MHTTQEIADFLHKALEELHLSIPDDFSIDRCSNPSYGDYTSTLALQIFPTLNEKNWNSPRELAQVICEIIQRLIINNKERIIAQVSVAGPGFINFTLSHKYFTQIIQSFHNTESPFVHLQQGKKAVVEYSSPNIAKPFTIGHLRSTIIGDAVARLLSTIGYEVYRDNHLGDWGTQFGKLIVAIQTLGLGSKEANIAAISSSETPVKELVKLYVEFHDKAETDPALEDQGRDWFTKLEQGDREARELWQMCIDWSWQEFARIYQELDIAFTENGGRGYGESYFEDKMDRVVKVVNESGYLKEGEHGAKLFFFPDQEFTPLMILKKDGSTLYATRDLATDLFRLEHYGRDILIVNEVGAEQELYFRQLYRIEELLGWYTKGQRIHVKHGHFRFKEGKMSTRKGNVIWLEDVITEAKKQARALSPEASEKVIQQIAIGALKWNDLKRAAHLDVTFDWAEILSMNGNSGPYIQYTVVRASSVLAKREKSDSTASAYETYNFDVVERNVARELLFFPSVVEQAARDFAPHHLCTYLYDLASSFNSFYNTHRVLEESADQAKRIALTQATEVVLRMGLTILGIQVPEKM